jgi:hypothetical protein
MYNLIEDIFFGKLSAIIGMLEMPTLKNNDQKGSKLNA